MIGKAELLVMIGEENTDSDVEFAGTSVFNDAAECQMILTLLQKQLDPGNGMRFRFALEQAGATPGFGYATGKFEHSYKMHGVSRVVIE